MEVAQAVRNTAPVLARNCMTYGNSSQGHGNCMYSSAIGPVKSPLMIEIWQGDMDALQNLIKTVANLNILIPLDCYDGTKKLYTTPLIQAIQAAEASRFRSASPEMLEFLLNHGADPNFLVS